jgi:diguanylate cyclase (GGDEF)-like protein
MGVDDRGWVEGLISVPTRAATIYWLAGVVSGLVAITTGTWSQHAFNILVVSIIFAAVAAAVRVVGGQHFPMWTLYLDAVAAIVIISVVTTIGPHGHVDFAVLYILMALFSALYFRPVHALAMLSVEGAAYAGVLVWGPHVANPVASWFAIFGTGLVMSSVVLTLVGELSRSSREDALTGLPNRRTWDERIDEELERARRSGAPLSIAVFDIDRFKSVNDERGHLAGDLVLRGLAAGWREILRGGGDIVARIGGDEFGLIAPGANERDIDSVVARLSAVSPDGVSCSFGVATWDRAESAANLFRRADETMYKVKREKQTPP